MHAYTQPFNVHFHIFKNKEWQLLMHYTTQYTNRPHISTAFLVTNQKRKVLSQLTVITNYVLTHSLYI